MSKVYVVGGDPLVEDMFRDRGYDIATDDNHDELPFDLICFTGGADVNPKVYGEEPNGARGWDDLRDEREVEIFNTFKGSIPMVGICRGGQLLNVLNGGKMIQDHGLISGDVTMFSRSFDGYLTVRVDHHQGMLAPSGMNTFGWNEGVGMTWENPWDFPDYIIWYPETKCLCFQPHPEWGHKGTEELFFNLIEEYVDEA